VGNKEVALVAAASPLDELLSRVAAAAIELVGSPAAERLGYCDSSSCGQFFTRSRSDQRWCGTACGTRVRVARHAQARRVKAA
jgi:predicted RNA-binding Zn ribbon-like protein